MYQQLIVTSLHPNQVPGVTVTSFHPNQVPGVQLRRLCFVFCLGSHDFAKLKTNEDRQLRMVDVDYPAGI